MSTKNTLFLTHDNEHCYEETVERDGSQYRIYLEVDAANLAYHDLDEDRLIIAIRGDSGLAQVLRTCHDTMRVVSGQITDECVE